MNGDPHKRAAILLYIPSGSFDTYIYRKGSDAGDNFMGISIKSDTRRSYIQRIVVPLPNKWKKYEQKFANIT